MALTIVADDLTGACDTGTLFTALSPVAVTVWPGTPPAGDVRVVDTETRALDNDAAAGRVARAAALVPASRYFKKIDSTMRGRIGAEVDALMRASGARAALVCPAFPAQGRAVVDRILLIDGRPISQTPLADDPEFPSVSRSACASSVVDLLRPQIDRPLAWIPIDHVRTDAGALASRLGRLAGTVTVADAETEGDLEALVNAALLAEPSPLLVGSAGLAAALARRLGLFAGRVALPPARRWLIVAGSRHPITRGQAVNARRAGLTVVTTDGTDEADHRAVAARLAAEARRQLESAEFDIVAVTGGETAVALYEALDADRIDLLGAPGPGLALGHLRSGLRERLPLLTKAGGFGGPDLFVELAKEAAA